jgi:amino acid transporter
MLFAFSRDDGVPGISKLLAKVSPTYRVPHNAIWGGSLLSVLFVWFTSALTIAGTPAYSIVVSCTVIFLFLSFAVPIALALFTYGTAKFPKAGPWDLGGVLFRLVCVLSLISMAIIFYAGIQPPNDWALPITVGFIVLSLVIWLLFENRRFKGPPIGAEIAKRAAEIKAAEAAVGGAIQ